MGGTTSWAGGLGWIKSRKRESRLNASIYSSLLFDCRLSVTLGFLSHAFHAWWTASSHTTSQNKSFLPFHCYVEPRHVFSHSNESGQHTNILLCENSKPWVGLTQKWVTVGTIFNLKYMKGHILWLERISHKCPTSTGGIKMKEQKVSSSEVSRGLVHILLPTVSKAITWASPLG